jgi:hypothetical protein
MPAFGGRLSTTQIDANREPPLLVEEANAAVRWVSRALVDLDQDAPDATAAIIDGLGCVLALGLFAAVARDLVDA